MTIRSIKMQTPEGTVEAVKVARVILADSACGGMSTREASDAYYPDDAGVSGAMRWSA